MYNILMFELRNAVPSLGFVDKHPTHLPDENERIKQINPLLISGHTMQLATLLQKAISFAHGSANQYKVAFPRLVILQG